MKLKMFKTIAILSILLVSLTGCGNSSKKDYEIINELSINREHIETYSEFTIEKPNVKLEDVVDDTTKSDTTDENKVTQNSEKDFFGEFMQIIMSLIEFLGMMIICLVIGFGFYELMDIVNVARSKNVLKREIKSQKKSFFKRIKPCYDAGILRTAYACDEYCLLALHEKIYLLCIYIIDKPVGIYMTPEVFEEMLQKKVDIRRYTYNVLSNAIKNQELICFLYIEDLKKWKEHNENIVSSIDPIFEKELRELIAGQLEE